MPTRTAEKTVLVIDDDDDLANVLVLVLERAGYRVHRAQDGEEGVRLAARLKPDLIILDWMMPVKDGFSACQELRGMDDLRQVPILAFTAFGQNIGEIHRMGNAKTPPLVQDCLEKPVELNVLLERVAGLLAGTPGPSAGAS